MSVYEGILILLVARLPQDLIFFNPCPLLLYLSSSSIHSISTRNISISYPPQSLPSPTPQPSTFTMSDHLGLALYHYTSIHYHLACHLALMPSSPPLTLSHTPAGQTPPPPIITSITITNQLRYASKQIWRYTANLKWSGRQVIGLFAVIVFGFPVTMVGGLYVLRRTMWWLLPELCEVHT